MVLSTDPGARELMHGSIVLFWTSMNSLVDGLFGWIQKILLKLSCTPETAANPADAEIPFDWILDRITRSDPSLTATHACQSFSSGWYRSQAGCRSTRPWIRRKSGRLHRRRPRQTTRRGGSVGVRIGSSRFRLNARRCFGELVRRQETLGWEQCHPLYKV